MSTSVNIESKINSMAAMTGRRVKEDSTNVNVADMLESIYKALVVDKNAGVSVTGSLTNRGPSILHRSAITAVDKVLPVTITAAKNDVVAGSLTAVAHGIAVAPGNSYGNAGASAVVTVTPTASKSIDIVIPQSVGADYYDICLSTSTTSPAWVARITETQRATGCAITAMGAVESGGSAGVVNVQIVGTGLASTTGPFVGNNAYVLSGIIPVSCVGKKRAYIYVDYDAVDLRSLNTLGIMPFLQNSTGGWFQSEGIQLGILYGSTGQSLKQVFMLDVDSAIGVVILIDNISGNGAMVSINVELVDG